MGFGLVLEGGAMRGMFTAGVLDVFMEEGIMADGVVGVSAGALFGVNYLSGQKGRVIRYNKRFNADRNYIGLRPLLQEGSIVSIQYAYHQVPHHLDPFDDEQFQKSGIPFYAVVTNIRTGQPEYIRIQSGFTQMDVLRASGSMPFVSRPVVIGNEEYLDGGISDSIPFRWMADQGYDKLVVVLTRDITYRKKPANAAYNLYRSRYPHFAELLKNRYLRYNACLEELAQWESEGKAFVIRPSCPITLATMERDPEKLQQVYDLGTRDAREALPGLDRYLAAGKAGRCVFGRAH